MIKYKYIAAWNEAIFNEFANNSESVDKELLALLPAIHLSASTANAISHNLQKTVEVVLNYLDQDKSLKGLFNALDLSRNRVSPFIATTDFCIKILEANINGQLILNISPIFRLGPEYPQHYQEKNGTALKEDAILGLLEVDADETQPHDQLFSLGIDAGIAFKDSNIIYNRQLSLCLSLLEEGIMATLTCENQVTSKVFYFAKLGELMQAMETFAQVV